ncbi:MAG: hypothetical protein PHX38_06845 [Sulfuricella sp.]|nr:hypothetical protein [Sulfuricella sp.]
MGCETAVNWANAATWGLVLAGWFVVHKMALSRERRKENRDAVNRVIEEIKSVGRMAIVFHTSDSFNSETSDSLIWQVSRINRTLQRAPLNMLNIPLSLMVRFKKGLTLQNTDASTFTPQSYHGDIIKGIRTVTDQLLETIEEGRDKKYP